VALLVTTLLIYLTGLITAHIVGRRVIHWGERLLLKLPLVRPIYAASKQVVETFSSSTQAAFQAVVLVEFPRQGSLAVASSRERSQPGGKDALPRFCRDHAQPDLRLSSPSPEARSISPTSRSRTA
jgi:uncharacterized membrane protein